MDTGISHIGDFAEGGNHGLLFVIYGVEAGSCHADKNHEQPDHQNIFQQAFDIRLFPFGRFRLAR